MAGIVRAGWIAQWSFAVLAAAALAACATNGAGDGARPAQSAADAAPATPAPATPVSATPAPAAAAFATLDQSATSRIDAARTVVVKDGAAWQRLWAEHAGADGAPPQVDFSKNMVVGVFLGTRSSGCYTATIAEVRQVGATLRVRAVERVPGPTVRCMMMITTPAHLVAVARSDLAVEFATETVELK